MWLVNRTLTEFLDTINPGADHVINTELIGSTAILGEGADIDVLVYSPVIASDNVISRSLWHTLVEDKGWDSPVDNPYTDGDLMAYRYGAVNLIVCLEESGYIERVRAKEVCVYLESKVPGLMKDKTLRVDVHRIIRGQSVG